MVAENDGRADGRQNGPGEQLRPRDDRENFDTDNLRGGADSSGGRSSEVPRDNGRDNPGAEQPSKDATTSGGLPPGDVEDRDVSTVKPEDYPPGQRASTDTAGVGHGRSAAPYFRAFQARTAAIVFSTWACGLRSV